MKTFIISYDLGVPENRASYIALADHLKRLYAFWARPVESVWIIKSDKKASQIRDEIINVLDKNDKLIVVELNRDWGTYNVPKDVTNWMDRNM